MVSFDHRDDGTHEDEWQSSGRLSGLAVLDPDRLLGPGAAHVVILAAHPDDETLGAAGLAARAQHSGARLTYLVATDGESSHPTSQTVTVEELTRVRRTEVVAAVQRVAPGAAVHLLGLPDGGLRENVDALHDAVVAAVQAGTDPAERRVLCAPWVGDGHRDHRILGEVARKVAARHGVSLLEYPVWLWHWGSPSDVSQPWDEMRRLDLTPEEQALKVVATAEHRSQVAPLSARPGDEATLGPEMLRHFERDHEVFVLSAEQPATARAVPEDAAGSDEGVYATPGSLGEEFFDDFYAGRQDPWGFESRWYEERKRAVTLASLPRRRFRAALEIGCSTGVLTDALAERCDTVLGVDIAAAPLEAARRRLGDRARLVQLTTPAQWPEGEFDLVVLSEVGYYYGHDDLASVLDQAVASLSSDGVLLLCHWRHLVAEYPLGGDEVHTSAASRSGLVRLVHHVEEDFLLDVLVRPPAVSVARETGLL